MYSNPLITSENYTNPLEVYLKDNWNNINFDRKETMYIYFYQINYLTDFGFLLEDWKEVISYEFTKSHQILVYNTQSNLFSESTFATINFEAYTIGKKFTRSFTKIQDVLTRVGGLIKALSIVGEWAAIFFSRTELYSYIIWLMSDNDYRTDKSCKQCLVKLNELESSGIIKNQTTCNRERNTDSITNFLSKLHNNGISKIKNNINPIIYSNMGNIKHIKTDFNHNLDNNDIISNLNSYTKIAQNTVNDKIIKYTANKVFKLDEEINESKNIDMSFRKSNTIINNSNNNNDRIIFKYGIDTVNNNKESNLIFKNNFSSHVNSSIDNNISNIVNEAISSNNTTTFRNIIGINKANNFIFSSNINLLDSSENNIEDTDFLSNFRFNINSNLRDEVCWKYTFKNYINELVCNKNYKAKTNILKKVFNKHLSVESIIDKSSYISSLMMIR